MFTESDTIKLTNSQKILTNEDQTDSQKYSPTRMEKKKTPVIQLQVMNKISGMFCGFLFFPIEVAVFVAK